MALIGHIGWRAIDRLLRVSLGWDGLAQHTLGPILTGKGKSKHKCVETMWIMISEPIAIDRASEALENTAPPAP
jgi:hypothetical protein